MHLESVSRKVPTLNSEVASLLLEFRGTDGLSASSLRDTGKVSWVVIIIEKISHLLLFYIFLMILLSFL